MDLDGVLFAGTNEGYFDCHHHALESVGVRVPRPEQRQRLLEYWSYPHEFQLALFVHDEEKLAAACRAYEESLFSDAFVSRITEIPGAARTIDALSHEGFRLAIASGMHDRQIPAALHRIGVDPGVFAACVSAYQYYILRS